MAKNIHQRNFSGIESLHMPNSSSGSGLLGRGDSKNDQLISWNYKLNGGHKLPCLDLGGFVQGVSDHERIKWSPIVKVVDWPTPAFGRRHVKAFGRRLCVFSSSERVVWL